MAQGRHVWLVFLFLCLASFVFPQDISTNAPVPPLQWINLTPLLKGQGPPPLRDASIGYDSESNSLLIFGGESAAGIPTQGSFLLSMSDMSWSTPSPPGGLNDNPPARSAAVGAEDFAANYRRGHIIIGGKGSKGQPLSDVWAYNFRQQYWIQSNVFPAGPSARYGAIGGRNALEPFDMTTLNNTIFLAGGFDSSGPVKLSDAWEIAVGGILSANTASTPPTGGWSSSKISNDLPAKVGQAGVALSSGRLVVYGGCQGTAAANVTCADQGTFVLDVNGGNVVTPGVCPPPRIGGTLAPNYNTASSAFTNQALLLLGSFDTTLWSDDGGLLNGEVGVLDVSEGTWARVLPAGDPGSNGKPTFPTPRQGAVAVSWNAAMLGNAGGAVASDTIVFGGVENGTGNYLNELWLLRSYQGVVMGSGQKWEGFGDGTLKTGVNADGTGVQMQYLTACAQPLRASAPSGTSSRPSTSTHPSTSASSPAKPSVTGSPASAIVFPYDTTIAHKLLSPISLALLLVALLLFRSASPPPLLTSQHASSNKRMGLLFLSAITGVTAYALGLAGIVIAFQTTSAASGVSRRAVDSASTLKTNHGRAGIALFVGLYGLLPILIIFAIFIEGPHWLLPVGVSSQYAVASTTDDVVARKNSTETGVTSALSANGEKSGQNTPDHSRIHSWTAQSVPTLQRHSSDGGTGPRFEVVNRPQRKRRQSAFGALEQSLTSPDSSLRVPEGHPNSPQNLPRSLSEVNWLDRRRSVHALGELDHALQHMRRESRQRVSSTAPLFEGSRPPLDTPSLPPTPGPLAQSFPPPAQFPPPLHLTTHLLLHAFLLAACGLTLAALWLRAPRATFAIFLIWTVAFYACLVILAFFRRPSHSILVVLISRLRHQQPLQLNHSHNTADGTDAAATRNVVSPSDTHDTSSRSPYLYHQPSCRRAIPTDDLTSMSHGYRSHDEADEDDEDDEPEDERQRRMEMEMDRREVSIVTVPRRKLWIANPS